MNLHQLPVDLKAEVVLWMLMEAGTDWEQLLVQPVGTFRRAFSRDVEEVKTGESTSGKSQLHVRINRDGLYDALPEGLFHQPTTRKPNRTAAEIIEEMGKQQAKEAASRRFFLPVEQEFYRQRVQLTQEEQRYYLTPGNALTNQALVNFWEIPDFFDARQTFCLLHLLPQTHRIAGNHQLAASYFGLLTGNQVALHTVYETSHPVGELQLPRLGNAQAGVDFVIGESCPEQMAIILITVMLDTPRQLTDYLPGGKGLPIIQYLAHYLLPCETDWQLTIELTPEHQSFVLSPDAYASRLGYSTVVA